MNPSLRRHQRDWEDLGDLDPCWAILAYPERRFGRWDLEEFFRSGEIEIARLTVEMQRLGYPARRERALDFGCGVGRLTRTLAPQFRHCYGVDVSASMIAAARKLNAACPNCEFVVNGHPDLRMFPGGHFDLIYSVLVLQHLADPGRHRRICRRLCQDPRPGRAARLSDPDHIPLRRRLQLRRRLYGILRGLGVESCFRYRRRVPPRSARTAPPRDPRSRPQGHRGADHTSPISLHAGEVMRISLLEALASAGWTGGAPPYEGRRPSGR